jgi:hypothetical protein
MAIRWRPISDLSEEPDYGDYLIWLMDVGPRSVRWLPEMGGWLAGGQMLSRHHATHFAKVNAPVPA